MGFLQERKEEMTSLRQQLSTKVTRALLAGKIDGFKAAAMYHVCDEGKADVIHEICNRLGIVPVEYRKQRTVPVLPNVRIVLPDGL